jgi:hypothetical protein
VRNNARAAFRVAPIRKLYIPLHVDQIFMLRLIVAEPWLLQPLVFFAITQTLSVRRECMKQTTKRIGLGYDVQMDRVLKASDGYRR